MKIKNISDRIIGMVDRLGLPEDMPIDAKMLSNTIESAQKKIEDQNFRRRKNVLAYDDVMNQQRNIIYKQRNDVLMGEDISGTVLKMILSTVDDSIERFLGGEEAEFYDFAGLREHYKGLLFEGDEFTPDEHKELTKSEIAEMLEARAQAIYEEKENLVGEERFRELERAVLLGNVDRSWMEHIDAMDDLKDSLRFQTYAQRDPITEYRIEGADMFDAMIEEIRDKTARMILSVTIKTPDTKRTQVAVPLGEGFEGDGAAVKKVTSSKKKEPDRNDPCPCGSGKKYKKCCGASGN